MGRPLLTIGLLACGGLLASVVGAAPPAVVGTSLHPAPQSRMEGNQAVDDATAAALIGAISDQFSERNVEVKLDTVRIAPAGIVQREISGQGRLLLGATEDWIPFRFKALYDTEQASVGNPDLTLGDDAPGRFHHCRFADGQGSGTPSGHATACRIRRSALAVRCDSIRVARARAADTFASKPPARRTSPRKARPRAGVHGLYDSAASAVAAPDVRAGRDGQPRAGDDRRKPLTRLRPCNGAACYGSRSRADPAIPCRGEPHFQPVPNPIC